MSTSGYVSFDIRARQLQITHGGVDRLAPVSFQLRSGELLALYGSNGAGKTSLLRLLAGFLRCTAGQLDQPDDLRRHYIGHAPGVSGALSLAENMTFWFGDVPHDALEQVGLTALRNMPAHLLSAGQRRRLAFTRLMADPRPLWLLDEPFAELDSSAVSWLESLVRAHCQNGGAIVMASHRPIDFATKKLVLGARQA